SVFRSNRFTVAQLIDDDARVTIAHTSTRELAKEKKKAPKRDLALVIGEMIAEKAKKIVGYTVAGILLIAASFAIVNTVLKAPSGTDRSPTETQSDGTTTVTSGVQGGSYSDQILSISRKILKTYSNYAISTFAVTAIEQSIDTAWNTGAKFTSLDDGFGALGQIENRWNEIRSELDKIANRYSGLTIVGDIVAQQKLFVANWLEKVKQQAEAIKKNPPTDCSDTNYSLIDMAINKDKLDAAKNCAKDPPGNYYNDFLSQWNEFVKTLKTKVTYDKEKCAAGNAGSGSCNIQGSYAELKAAIGSEKTDGLQELKTEFDVIKGAFSEKVSDSQKETLESISADLQTLKSAQDIKSAKDTLAQILKDLETTYAVLKNLESTKNLQGVKVRLTADVSEGSAPLTVNFSTVGSSDPTEKTIKAENIQWFPGSTCTAESGKCSLDGDVNISCTPSGATASCTFKKPGSYKIGVKIKSQDSEKYASGVAFKSVNVSPQESVKVKLTANVSQGSSPLVVNFSTVGSNDPSQKSILPENITWNLGENADVVCTKSGAVASCLYKKAGSYKAGAKIKSQDNQKFAEGEAFINVNVNPPSGQINLKYKVKDTDDEKYLIHYSEEGTLIENRDVVYIALSSIPQDGIQFNAEDTKDAAQFRWNFGDGSGEITGSPKEPSIVSPKHLYTKEGNYRVTLEVTGTDGSINRKIVEIIISKISAGIEIFPAGVIRTGVPVELRGEIESDRGRATGTWSATSSTTDNEADKIKGNDPILKITFGKPAKYSITYSAENEFDDGAKMTLDLAVESTPPVAKMKVTSPWGYRPADFQLDGSPSYDPDGTNNGLTYSWEITGEEGKDYKFIEGDKSAQRPVVRFLKTGEYPVKLIVNDKNEPTKGTLDEKKITVKNLLDIAWPETNPVSAQMNTDQQAKLSFTLESENGANYDIDFGDNEVENGVFKDGKATFDHIFTKSGAVQIKATAYDTEGNKNTLMRRVIIGGSDKPLAVVKVSVNNEEVDPTQPIVVNRKATLSFNASDSKNSKGGNNGLTYSWNFGDGKKSTKPVVSYIYKETNPQENAPSSPSYYTVTLTVSDEKDPAKSDIDSTIRVRVINQKPTLKSMIVIPQGQDLKTPVSVQVRAIDAKDLDGQIVTYRWWYYDVRFPDEEIGTRVTTSPNVTFNIGTRGQEGETVDYAFALEMKDDEGQISKASDLDPFEKNPPPTITLINGPNKIPTAKFTVSKTSINIGETITFASTSTDVDGQIEKYVWDFEGDGFFNNEETNKSTITVNFLQEAPKGIKTRLKVIDNNFGEAISEPFMIYVIDPNKKVIEPPKIMQQGLQQKTTDAGFLKPKGPLLSTTAGLKDAAPENAQGANDPQKTFANPGTPNLTKIDARLTNKPEINLIDGKIHFKTDTGTVEFDFSKSEGNIIRYEFDKNIYFDTDGNGVKDDDPDYTTEIPGKWTAEFQKAWGKIAVKFSVFDAYGNKDSIIREIVFDGKLKSGATNIFVIPGDFSLYSALATMAGFGILTARKRKFKIRKDT
ncbi:MAG: 50S ribosomal protein L18, partial [Patescibacteria group bacterium]